MNPAIQRALDDLHTAKLAYQDANVKFRAALMAEYPVGTQILVGTGAGILLTVFAWTGSQGVHFIARKVGGCIHVDATNPTLRKAPLCVEPKGKETL